jgi:hypothetical protein
MKFGEDLFNNELRPAPSVAAISRSVRSSITAQSQNFANDSDGLLLWSGSHLRDGNLRQNGLDLLQLSPRIDRAGCLDAIE